ncbi:MAG: T9SS type A sorting domain-containing protein [Bacteroidales bacterium]
MQIKFKAITLYLFMISAQIVQAQNWNWAKSLSGPDNDEVTSVKVDARDNIYIGGIFKDTLFFTPNDYIVAPTNYYDGFIAKYDSSGSFLWSRKFGGNHNDFVRDFSIDDSGFVYVACQARSSNTITYGSFSYTGTGNDKTFILKIDSLGNLQWGKLLTAGISNAYPTSISTNAGLVAVTGTYGFLNMVIETDTLIYAGGEDIFLAVYESATGNLLWTKAINSQFLDYGKNVAVDDSANVYLAGIFNADLSIGGADTLFNPLGYEMFLCKHTASGNYLWSKRYHGSANHMVDGMTLNSSGDIYIAGYHKSGNHVLNDTAFSSLSYNNFFLQKLDYNGDSYWTRSFPTGNLGRISDIATDTSDNVYMAGYLGSNFSLDTFQLTGSSNNYRNFIAQVNSSGDVVHALDGGNKVNNNGYNNLTSGFGGIYLVGYFGSSQGHTSAYGNDTLVSTGGRDGFIVKYASLQNTSCQVASDFITSATHPCMGDTVVFLNQSSSATHYEWYVDSVLMHSGNNYEVTFLQPGTHEIMLVAFDSICSDTNTIQITVHQAYNSSETHTICKGDTFFFGSKEITDPGHYIDSSLSINGCDSISHLFLSVHEIDTSILVSQNVLTAVDSNLTYQWVDCDNHFSHISGADGQHYTASQNGSYAVILSDSLCSDTSACHSITDVGIFSEQSNNNVVYYPNPVKDILVIEISTPTTFKLYDLLGNKVMAGMLSSGRNTIDLSKHTPGMYIIVFELPGHSLFDKILVQ